MTELQVGYIPLTDAAVLLAAAERGFAEARGLRLHLRREASWATLRDRLVLGHVDVAHLLAPLAAAISLGLAPGPALPLTAGFALNLNGNAVTLSAVLWDEAAPPEDADAEVAAVAAAVGVAARRHAADGRPLRLATTFPYSSHTYLLRGFLQAGGVDPDRDVLVTVMPPPYMADALAAGEIDGFCVGSPWNSVAVAEGSGRIAALGCRLRPDTPEKVAAWRRGHLPDQTALALVASLKEAAAWCAAEANREELAALVGSHLDVPPALILPTLRGRMPLALDGPVAVAPDYLRLGGDAHRPDPRHAAWIRDEMIAAGQVDPGPGTDETFAALYDPSFFDRTLVS